MGLPAYIIQPEAFLPYRESSGIREKGRSRRFFMKRCSRGRNRSCVAKRFWIQASKIKMNRKGRGMKTVDMHCDTVSRLYKKRKQGSGERLAENGGHVDLKKLKAGDALLQNFALFVDLGKTGDPWEDVMGMADLYDEELKENEERIAPVSCYGDIEKNSREGKMSALLTVEEGGVCQGSIARLQHLYSRGVRMMTLTWNYPNEIGYPAINARDGWKKDALFYKKADRERGLTEKGKEFVLEMERMGMAVDVSHLSDKGFYDVWQLAKKPFAASHSNARAVCPWVRNLTDDMIKKLADKGGVVGLNFCPDFLEETAPGEENPGSIAAIVRHVKHIIRVGGAECIGLGSDFDGIEGHGELPDFSYMPRLCDALRKSGLKEGEIEKIFFKNVLRFYKELL